MQAIATVVCRAKANASLEGATWSFRKYTAKFSGKRVKCYYEVKVFVQLQGRYSDVTFICCHLTT